MQESKGIKQDNPLSPSDLIAIIGQCVEELCHRQTEQCLDNSNNIGGKQDGVSEMIKLVQLIEKYVSLREKIVPEQEEKIEIDYALLREYLERKTDA